MTVPTSVHHELDLKISPLETECSLDTAAAAAAVDSSEGDPGVDESEETSWAADNAVPSNPESFVLDFALPYLLLAFLSLSVPCNSAKATKQTRGSGIRV